MLDPIGSVEVDPVTRLRDGGLLIQQPERERLADEIEWLRAALNEAVGFLDDAQSGYIPGCGEDEKWNKLRDQFLSDVRAHEKGD